MVSAPGDVLTLQKVRADRYDGGWKRTIETWLVREPLEKLRAKYAGGGSLIFDHYVFHYPHRTPNRITPVDLAAVDRLMAGNISAKTARWNRLIDSALLDSVERVLSKIPHHASIDAPDWDGLVAEAVAALVQPEVQVAIATKLLMVKRPWLVPMIDSRIQHVFDREEDVPAVLVGMRRLLSDNREVIERLRRAVAEEFTLDISPLRVLDQLLWFDWNTAPEPEHDGLCHVLGFPDWVYDTRHHDQGVFRRA